MPGCGKEKRGRNCLGGGGGCRQVSWDDWPAMADIWRMARTKRTECLWSQLLTGCVHYRWPRDWFVSLSKTRTHRRRPPPPSLPALFPRTLDARSPGVTWSPPLVSKVYFSATTRPNGSRWRPPDELLSELILSVDNVETPFHRYQLVRFANLYSTAPSFSCRVCRSSDGWCLERVDGYKNSQLNYRHR